MLEYDYERVKAIRARLVESGYYCQHCYAPQGMGSELVADDDDIRFLLETIEKLRALQEWPIDRGCE